MFVMALAFFIDITNMDELIKKSIVCKVCYEFVSVKGFQRLSAYEATERGRNLRVYVVSFKPKAGGRIFEARWKYVITLVLTDAKDGNVFCMFDLTGLWTEVNTLHI